MRKVLLALALLGMVGGAGADDLSDGVFIAHNVPSYQYSFDAPVGGYCSAYDDDPLTDFAQQNPQVLAADPYQLDHFFVLCAWDEAKEFCAAEFGLGDYNTALFAIVNDEPCGIDPLTIPTSGWPGPNEGIAISVAAANAWFGQFVQVYFFGGYVYGPSAGMTMIPLTEDPAQSFIGTASCDTPPVTYPAYDAGAFGINQDGVPAFPPQPEPGACCYGPDCVMELEEVCIDQGGEWVGGPCEDDTCAPPPPVAACCLENGDCVETLEIDCQGVWHPEWETCDVADCPMPRAACCFENGDCADATEMDCEEAGGIWHPEWPDCAVADCPQPPPTGACCIVVPGAPHECVPDVTQMDCEEMGGVAWFEDTDCTDDLCEPFTPAENTSWGSIKGMYR